MKLEDESSYKPDRSSSSSKSSTSNGRNIIPAQENQGPRREMIFNFSGHTSKLGLRFNSTKNQNQFESIVAAAANHELGVLIVVAVGVVFEINLIGSQPQSK